MLPAFSWTWRSSSRYFVKGLRAIVRLPSGGECNGCYRLHPVEWNIGESAGMLAAFCLGCGRTPHQVREPAVLTREFQSLLRDSGEELEWPRPHPV